MNPYDLVEAEATAKEVSKCLTCAWLRQRDDEERAAWEDILSQPHTVWKTVHVFDAMVKVGGVNFTLSGLRNHRNRTH